MHALFKPSLHSADENSIVAADATGASTTPSAISAHAQRTVVCMKWGTKYGAEYVNVLARMVRRHCTLDYRFVCITDDVSGLLDDVETLPLQNRPTPNRPVTEAWRKLQLFDSANGLMGTCLFFDLDVAITACIDPLFDMPGEFCIIKNWTHEERGVGNSSVMRFTAGAHAEVFQDYSSNPDYIAAQYRNEQTYLSEQIAQTSAITWWPNAWCKSYKKHCLASGIRRLSVTPALPRACRVLVFHGNPNPPDAAEKWIYRTDKRFRLPKVARPAPWIKNYWR